MDALNLVAWEPGGGPAGSGLAPASGTAARAESLFDREVERATERAGGEAAVEARRSAASERRRGERHSTFGAGAEPARAARAAREERAERPAVRRDPRSADPSAPPMHTAPGRAPEAERAAPGAPPVQGGPGPAAAATAGAPGAPALPPAAGGPGAAPSASPPAGPAGPAALERPAPGAGAAEAAPRPRADLRAEGPARPAPAPAAEPEAAPEDAHDVLRQIRLHLAHGVREATLTLVPLHLGRLQVKLSLGQGQVAAVVHAESKETLELLERHLPELRAALAEQGFAVGSFELELGSPPDDRRTGRDDTGARSARRDARLDESAVAGRLAHLLQRLSPSAGGVDTYA